MSQGFRRQYACAFDVYLYGWLSVSNTVHFSTGQTPHIWHSLRNNTEMSSWSKLLLIWRKMLPSLGSRTSIAILCYTVLPFLSLLDVPCSKSQLKTFNCRRSFQIVLCARTITTIRVATLTGKFGTLPTASATVCLFGRDSFLRIRSLPLSLCKCIFAVQILSTAGRSKGIFCGAEDLFRFLLKFALWYSVYFSSY